MANTATTITSFHSFNNAPMDARLNTAECYALSLLKALSMGEEGIARPCINSLAQRLRVKRRRCIDILEKLRALGFIKIVGYTTAKVCKYAVSLSGVFNNPKDKAKLEAKQVKLRQKKAADKLAADGVINIELSTEVQQNAPSNLSTEVQCNAPPSAVECTLHSAVECTRDKGLDIPKIEKKPFYKKTTPKPLKSQNLVLQEKVVNQPHQPNWKPRGIDSGYNPIQALWGAFERPDAIAMAK